MNLFFKKLLEKLHLTYKGKSIFTKFYWTSWWDRKRRGFDITDTWNLDYTFAKFMTPRLLAFTSCIADKNYPTGIPSSILDELVAKYKHKGYKYKDNYQFEDKEINKKIESEAQDKWFHIVDTITAGFQDFLLEDEHYTEWEEAWNAVLEEINFGFKKCKNKAQKAKFLKQYHVPYFDYINKKVDIYYLSHVLRKKSLQLLSKHFYDLWW